MRQRSFECTPCGLASGAITVEAEDDAEGDEEESTPEDDGITVDEEGTEWWEDEEGVWWYREDGWEDWAVWED